MTNIDIFEQYLAGTCTYNGVERRGVLVKLNAESDAGNLRYTVLVSFFPHENDEDFAVSYDAMAEEILFDGKGRRSKKRDAAMLKLLHETADRLAESLGGTIDWEHPLREARLG